MWKPYQPNPKKINVGDCTVRALCAVTGLDWRTIHRQLCDLSEEMADMPSADRVWWALLARYGFNQYATICNGCTVKAFARTHPRGSHVLSPSGHAVAVIDGDWWDSWDSGDTIPAYYFRRN